MEWQFFFSIAFFFCSCFDRDLNIDPKRFNFFFLNAIRLLTRCFLKNKKIKFKGISGFV